MSKVGERGSTVKHINMQSAFQMDKYVQLKEKFAVMCL